MKKIKGVDKPDKRRLKRFTDLTNPWQRFRARIGYSQKELALALGATQGNVSDIENWKIRPSIPLAKRFVALCRQHHVPGNLDEVFSRVPMEKRARKKAI